MPQERMRIAKYIEWELNMFRKECNFTPDELCFFNYRASDVSINAITFKMAISPTKANTLSKSTREKMLKVLSCKRIIDKYKNEFE